MQALHHRRCRPFSACSVSGRGAVHRVIAVRSGKDDAPAPAISEEVLARLKAAEEEAARLRKELAEAQAAKLGGVQDVIESKAKPRIDSQDNRETLFSTGQRAAWLSEKDVDFFIGSGVGETSASSPDDPEAKATVQRRLAIGGVLSLALGAFALVPTEALRPRPSKPMYFYIVSILRIQDLVQESKAIIDDADWEQLRVVILRVFGTPNNARDSLDAIVALIDDKKRAERVQQLSVEVLDYLNAMDFNKYFESMPKRALTGAENAQFVAFSSQARAAAEGKIAEFLAALPAEEVAKAREQLAAGY